MKRLLVGLVLLLTLAAAPAAHAAAYTATDEMATMDDGVGIAVTLYQPVGLGPARASGVMLLHGIGGSRAQVARNLVHSRVQDGLLGDFAIDENGDTTLNTMGIYRIEDGKLRFERAISPDPELLGRG